MKLIVGLGNPGRKYAKTRHNVGFEAVAELARRYGQGRARGRFHADTLEAMIDGCSVLLQCPQTYMNRSGLSVREAFDFYKLDVADLLIICDDVHLPLAKLRCRARGSSGGQKGLADIIRCLDSEDVPRVRIGIGSPPAGWDVSDYVLSRFHADEAEAVQQAVRTAADAAADWARQGIEFCMNRYNANVEPSG